MHATAVPRPSIRRLAYALLSLVLLVAIVQILAVEGTGWWQLAAFGAGPDLALVLGAGRGLVKGRLHPRAVPAYNLLHRYRGPLALGALAALGVVGAGSLVGALAWALHVSVDRAVGYGLRTPDGFQRS